MSILAEVDAEHFFSAFSPLFQMTCFKPLKKNHASTMKIEANKKINSQQINFRVATLHDNDMQRK